MLNVSKRGLCVDPTSRDLEQQYLLDCLLKQYRVVAMFKAGMVYSINDEQEIYLNKTLVVKQLFDAKAERSYFILPAHEFTFGSFGQLYDILGLVCFQQDRQCFVYQTENQILQRFVAKEFGTRERISLVEKKGLPSIADIAREYEIMRKVYRADGVFFLGNREHCYILQPCLGNIELFDLINKDLTEDDSPYHLNICLRLELCFMLANSLSNQMHELGYVHADLRPENVMVTIEFNEVGELCIKGTNLIDFGMAQAIGVLEQDVSIWSAQYMPPEKRIPNYRYETSFDVFSLGRIFCMVFGLLKFLGHDNHPKFQGLETDDKAKLIQLLREMIKKDKDQRIPLSSVKDFFEKLLVKYHPTSSLLQPVSNEQSLSSGYASKLPFFADMERASALNIQRFTGQGNGYLSIVEFRTILERATSAYQIARQEKKIPLNLEYLAQVLTSTDLYDFILRMINTAKMAKGYFTHDSLICYFFKAARELDLLDNLLRVLMIDQLCVDTLCLYDRKEEGLFTFCLAPGLTEAEVVRDKLFQALENYVASEKASLRVDF